jgi:hypothetical protein
LISVREDEGICGRRRYEYGKLLGEKRENEAHGAAFIVAVALSARLVDK